MKQRILIICVLAVCIGFICFGVCSLCSHRNDEVTNRATGIPDSSETTAPEARKQSASGMRESVSNNVQGVRHYDNLDYVVIPSSIVSQDCEYEGFRLSFNEHNRTPNWVAWELLENEINGENTRHNKFWKDINVKGCPTTNDYRSSGYDRGHMCPAADQKWSQKAMDDCFVMANMCPQDHALNSGAWNTLENKGRNWVKRDSALVIVAGPIYSKDDTTTIGGGVLVPGAFFKAILAPYVEKPRAIAFVFPNMSAPGNMQNYVMTVDDLEKLTGYDFFSSLPDSIENDVESVASFREWNSR